MAGSPRRTFLKYSGLAAGAVAATQLAKPSRASAIDTITLACIGCGGQGTYLARSMAAQKGARVAYVCDPDRGRAEQAASAVAEVSGQAPKVVGDLRHVLDDTTIDAVTVAAPDHWHAPATILACAAGKHVYVEKPCAHNVREGRMMIDAARKHRRVVQVGTQSRSAEHIRRGIELIKDGAIGEVLVSKAWNSQMRSNIGHASPTDPPGNFDYDLWVGPAPMVPYQANRCHYNWHWWYDFGTGDMGNDGVHELDVARWGLGVETHPSMITACGGKYFFDDDQQFPDTQYVSFEYSGDGRTGNRRQLIYEMRIWSPYVQEGHENGTAFYGTKGMLVMGKRNGWQLFGPKNQLRDSMKPTELGPAHHQDFLDSIREDRLSAADIEIGHLSSSLCHLGNLAARLGRSIRFDPKTESILGDDEAHRLLGRSYREGHWAAPQTA